MGCAGAKQEGVVTSPEERERQKTIEKMLKAEKLRYDSEAKLLLLGAGQSGKSTLVKQMKVIYMNGFTADECMQFRDLVHSNVFQAIRELVQGVVTEGLSLTDANAQIIRKPWLSDPHCQLTKEVAADITSLWVDPAVKEIFQQEMFITIGDSTPYFFENLDRLSDANYVPTVDDILRVRTKTTGVHEVCFSVSEFNFRMVDVGGQRSERRKWIHCFQGVTAVIFFVAMSEYNQYLIEDPSVNRMHESIALFEEIVNSRWFEKSSIILFLNKSDLFHEKIQRVDMKCLFPDYDGGCNYEAGCKFLNQAFMNLIRDKKKTSYCHITCATNTENIRFVFNSIKHTLMKETVSDLGMQI